MVPSANRVEKNLEHLFPMFFCDPAEEQRASWELCPWAFGIWLAASGLEHPWLTAIQLVFCNLEIKLVRVWRWNQVSLKLNDRIWWICWVDSEGVLVLWFEAFWNLQAKYCFEFDVCYFCATLSLDSFCDEVCGPKRFLGRRWSELVAKHGCLEAPFKVGSAPSISFWQAMSTLACNAGHFHNLSYISCCPQGCVVEMFQEGKDDDRPLISLPCGPEGQETHVFFKGEDDSSLTCHRLRSASRLSLSLKLKTQKLLAKIKPCLAATKPRQCSRCLHQAQIVSGI